MWSYHKIPKNKPWCLYFSKALFEGLILGEAYIRGGLSTEGSLCFKIDFLIVGSKFTVFALFYIVFEGNFPSTSPRGADIWRGDLTEGFFALPDWGAYIWRGLCMEGLIHGGAYFRNFTVCYSPSISISD